MKNEFAESFLTLAVRDKSQVFLTGDLGFNCFELLQKKLKQRFVNTGVAEQNMIDVAAGIAYTGHTPWTYSIASFLTLKTVEQIRNNVFARKLNVKLVGNGGGFGYGAHGTTHHVLEDLALFRSMPGGKIYVPAFSEDVKAIVAKMAKEKSASYLRLGFSPPQKITYSYGPFRQLHTGTKVTLIVLGPLAVQTLPLIETFPKELDLWVVTELPCKIPKKFWDSLRQTKNLIVAEEACEAGGLGEWLNMQALHQHIPIKSFKHIFAQHANKHYGSQQFFWNQNGMDTKGLNRIIKKVLQTK